jgi:hypothetical protein
MGRSDPDAPRRVSNRMIGQTTGQPAALACAAPGENPALAAVSPSGCVQKRPGGFRPGTRLWARAVEVLSVIWAGGTALVAFLDTWAMISRSASSAAGVKIGWSSGRRTGPRESPKLDDAAADPQASEGAG